MPTATQTDQTESQEATVVRFISRCHDQVLTRRPTRQVDNGMGGRMELTYEEWIARQEDANLERAEPQPIDRTPWKIEFEAHSYETSDPTIIEWLRKHPKFGTNGASGFYEEPPAPEDPTLAMREPLKKLARAAVQDPPDLDTIIAIRDTERDGLNRPAIVEAAEAALIEIAEGPSEPEADAGETGNGDPESTSQP